MFCNIKVSNILIFFKILFIAVVLLSQSGCGGEGCRTADEQVLGANVEKSQFTQVLPINKNVIKSSSTAGAIVLHNGTTESMAKENLWYDFRYQNNSDVMVTSGNKFSIDVSDSVVLSGTSQVLNVGLNNYIKINGSLNSGSELKPVKKKINKQRPTSILQTITYKIDGKYKYGYKYTVKDEDGVSVTLDDKSLTASGCDIDTKIVEKINYIWYFPKKIIFHKWIDDNYNIVNKIVTVNVDDNNLSCNVKSANGVLWYVCTFTYDERKLQYKRRVTPLVVNNYPQFEEQVSRTDDEIAEFLVKKTNGKDASRSGNNDISKCYNDDKMDLECIEKVLEREQKEQGQMPVITDDEYKQYYYMCIVGGKSSNNEGVCGNYKFGVIGTEDDRVTAKSPIMVIFKNNDEIYSTGRAVVYDNQECFQHNEYKDRFSPSSSATACSNSFYPQFCRMAPKNIEYNLHKIKKSNYDWLDHDAGEKEIEYCTIICPKKSGYNVDEVVGECPKDCIVQLYRDDGKSSGSDVKLSKPNVVSCIDYQHRRRKQADLRPGSLYDDQDNTLYYAIDNDILDDDKIDTITPSDMDWDKVRLPCLDRKNSNDSLNYRRINTSSDQTCCSDFSNTMQVTGEQGTGYFMCDDIETGSDCRTSLLTSTICTPSMIEQGNCYHIILQSQDDEAWHCFCDGRENDKQIINGLKFVKANTFDITKPAYFISKDAMRKYIGGSAYIPKIYPENDTHNVGLEYGLVPVASNDIVSIECIDEPFPGVTEFESTAVYYEKPDGYDDMDEKVKTQFNVIPNNCEVSGSYQTYESDNEMSFGKGSEGIVPIQWSNYPVRAGESVPISITTQNPILIKNGDKYIEMRNGNGLMVYLEPNDDDDVTNFAYSDPELWQCNTGMGGSYAYYRPYEYSDFAIKSDRNPRKIKTPNELWWYCDDERPMWFSGYDFKNIKTGKPVYMHTYDTKDVVKFIPKYSEDGTVPPHEDLPVEDVGCNEDGIPSSMVIDGKLYERSDISGLSYDYGLQYIYTDDEGQHMIPIDDSAITSKIYEKYAPKIIVVDLIDEGLENVQIQANTDKKEYNNLVRTFKKKDGNIVQAYYEFDYLSKHYKIRIEDSVVHKPAICYNEGERKSSDSMSDDKITEITNVEFTNDSKYYILNKSSDASEIFTRFGPFTGMHVNSSGLMLPAIYTTEGGCLEHFIYDEQDNVSTWYGVEATRILRKNISIPWRMEFTTPKIEYNDGQYLTEETYTGSNGTLSRCYNKVNFESCGVNDIPDIVLVDLSKTNNAKNKQISGSLILYKDENFIKYKTKYYRTVTFQPLGWNNYNLDMEDPIISSVKCNNYSNCQKDEIPVIEVTVNSVHYRIIDGDIIDGVKVEISEAKEQSVLSFDVITGSDTYEPGNYTIDNISLDTNAICFTSNKICSSYLDKYIGIDTFEKTSQICEDKDCKIKNEYLYSLSKIPYIVSCQNDKSLVKGSISELTSVYSSPYASDKSKTYPGNIGNNGGYVLKTNIHDFVTNQYFARCVPSWMTPKWMIMEQSNDPSTFYTGYSALSGTYIAPDKQQWNEDYVKNKYRLESVWKSYGGLVKNTIMNQTCNTKTLSGGAQYKTNCSLKNTSSFDASFNAKYPKQIIMVRPIVNDPINTSSDDCEINVTGTKEALTSIKMNSPFGFTSSMIDNYSLDRSEAKEDVHGVQKNETINGDGKHGMEFFKQSEFQRNMIGAGVLTAPWSTLSDLNGKSVIFDKNDKITFDTKGDYYVSGALSHKSQAYCMINSSLTEVGAISMYTIALDFELQAGVAIAAAIYSTKAAIAAGWPAAIPFLINAATCYGISLVAQASSIGFMVAGAKIAEAPKGFMHVERPDGSKRSCGVATAFRVVPIPPAACLSGYKLKCNNERINNYMDGDLMSDKILTYCQSEVTVDFRTQRMKIGSCKKQIKDIDTKNIIETRPQRYKNSDAKYPNTLVDAIGDWDDVENIYQENCGVCVKKKSIYTYNGITYSLDDLQLLPKTVRTEEHCRNYTDDEENTYTWLTDVKIITPFDKYTYANKNIVFNAIKQILVNKISTCSPDYEYVSHFDDQTILNDINLAFLNMQIRNVNACVSNMMSVYHYEISMSEITDECKSSISDDIESMAKSACNDMLAIIKDIDGKEYYSYFFTQNAVSANCNDNKHVREVSKKNNQLGSITRYDAENVLSEYGYGELTTDESLTVDGTTNINLRIPTVLNGKQFKTAKLGFFLAGDDNKNPLSLYENYRIINRDDLKRGYIVTIGNGLQARKGKYLYYYIQPLNDQGKPDPSYNPNVLFAQSNTKRTPEMIAENKLVYSFKDKDEDDDGKISVTAPRTGKLWVTILDSEKLAKGDDDADGKYITFNNVDANGTMQVSDTNVLYTNAGYYTAQAMVQTDAEDSIDSMISDSKGSGINRLLTSFVIVPIKKIFIGDYLCKRCSIKNPSKCEIKPDSVSDKDWYTNEYKKVCDYDWENGVLGQVATSFLRIHLLYVAWFVFVVFSVFVIGIQFITGEQKFDFKFMKKYLWRYALIMAFVNPQSLELYIRLFVKPSFNLAEGLSAFVAGNFSSDKYTSLDPENFMYSAFGPIDQILKFWINRYTFEKLLAILFSSWSGIVVVVLLLMCFIFFMISVIEAVILYIIILIKMSLYLAIGPVVFLLLIHEKTAGKFTEWWKTIAGCIAEQVMMFAGISFFGTIYYYILKGSMNFIYCWEPVLMIPILDIPLFSMWKIAGTMPTHMAELLGHIPAETALNTKGFNFLTAFMLFIISCMMSKFVDGVSNFGAKIFGQKSSMPSQVKQVLSQAKTITKSLPMKGLSMAKNSFISKNKSGNSEKREGT